MLAGRSAIARGTRRETLEHILEGKPDFTLLPASTPPLVSRLVRRCLEKDRRTRLRHIADARAYLDDAITIPSGAYEGTAARARRMGGWFVVLPALAGALAAGLVLWVAVRPAPARVTRTTVLTEAPAVLSVTPDKSLALTHDGTHLIYIGVSTGGSFSVGTARQVLPQGTLARIPATRWPSAFDVSGDGAQFLVQRPIETEKPSSSVAHVPFEWLAGRGEKP